MAELAASECGHATGSTGSRNQHGRDAVDVAGVATNVVGHGEVHRRKASNALGRYTIKRARNHVYPVATRAAGADTAVAKGPIRKASPVAGIRSNVTCLATQRAHWYMVCCRRLDREVGCCRCIQRRVGNAMALCAIACR